MFKQEKDDFIVSGNFFFKFAIIYIYIFIHIYINIYVCVCVYIYIYFFLSQTVKWLYVISQLNEKVPEICI